MDSKRPKHACVDCGKLVPSTGDDSTLVSMKYGWRLVRRKSDDGAQLIEWRCPACWTRFRTRESA